MKDRIKAIRKAKGETQLSFGEKLNVSKSSIEAIEYGRRTPTDRMIADICRVFNVNETWLLTGEGEMFSPLSREEEIAQMAAKVFSDDDPFRLKLMSLIAQLDEEQIELLKDIATNLGEIAKE